MSVSASPFSREKLLTIARSLPADLQVLSQLGEVLQDVNSDLDEIAVLLRRDVALASRIVRISNSAVFGGSRIGSVEEAVNRVGFSEILKLVGTATAARFSERALEHYDVDASRLRDNMLYTALAAEALARAAGTDSKMAYMAGLLRPLGLMVLDRAAKSEKNAANRFSHSRFLSYSAWEGGIFGLDNCEVTALILDEWRYPGELNSGLRLHYLRRGSDLENPLAVLLNLAGILAHGANHALAGEQIFWENTPAKLQAAGLSADDLSAASAAAGHAYDAAIAALVG